MHLFSFITPQTIGIFQSKINGEIKIVESFGRKAIYVNGAPQSGAEIRLMWEEISERIKKQELRITNCLVLGIGGGDVIKTIKKRFPQASITGIDSDPVMVDIAIKYFGLDNMSKLEIVITDAFNFIKKEKRSKFDLIIVDLFVGKLNPTKSRCRFFLRGLDRIRKNDGLILYNSHYREDNPDEFEIFKVICHKVFTRVSDIFSYRYNHVLLMSG